jgi:hypothetical protein
MIQNEIGVLVRLRQRRSIAELTEERDRAARVLQKVGSYREQVNREIGVNDIGRGAYFGVSGGDSVLNLAHAVLGPRMASHKRYSCGHA